MMKLHILLMLWSLSEAAYMSRMAVLQQAQQLQQLGRYRPTAFRPGVMMRPWTHPRLMTAASHRMPYVVYRNSPQSRYSMKHYTPTRVFSGPWKATRITSPSTAEYEFVRSASSTPVANSETGAIHTIPAPNLSLSEKPIVVVEADSSTIKPSSEAPKIYEVTEKYPDSLVQIPAKIEQPVGFSKPTLTQPELQTLVRNRAAMQLATELGLSAIALPQQSINHPLLSHHHHQSILPQTNLHHQGLHSIMPHQFALQSFNNLPNQQDMIQASADGLVISPSALYQPDPAFLQKLQNQLLQRFPGVEFVPYPADIQTQQQSAQHSISQPQFITAHSQNHYQNQQQQQPLFLLQNEQITNNNVPAQYVAAESQNQKSVVQRETQEGTVVTLVPQLIVTNVTEKQFEVTSASTPQNITVELIAAESKPEATTVKYIIETTTEEQKTTPVFIAQSQSSNSNLIPSGFTIQKVENIVANGPGLNIANGQNGQPVGNVVTDGFYSAINDVRAAAALAQVEKPQEPNVSIIAQAQENFTTTTNNPTTTINAELKAYFVQQPDGNKENKTGNEIKPILGVPFAKSQNSVNVAYTLLRSDDKDAKVAKDGSVYAGQIVEASVSEDNDYNLQKTNILNRRAPIRLVAVPDSKETSTTTIRVPSKVVVKARIPPKSKLTFDDKTGEPVLRIYASYLDNPAQVNDTYTSTEDTSYVLQKPSLDLTSTSIVYPSNDLSSEEFLPTTSKDTLSTSSQSSTPNIDYLTSSFELFITPTEIRSTSEKPTLPPSPVYIPFTVNDVLATPNVTSNTSDDLLSTSRPSSSE